MTVIQLPKLKLGTTMDDINLQVPTLTGVLLTAAMRTSSSQFMYIWDLGIAEKITRRDSLRMIQRDG